MDEIWFTPYTVLELELHGRILESLMRYVYYVKDTAHQLWLAGFDVCKYMLRGPMDPALRYLLVKRCGHCLPYVPFYHHRPDLCLAAVATYPRALKWIPRAVQAKHTSMILALVRENPHILKHVKNPTPAILLAAVQIDGTVLRYIIAQSLEICLTAVTQHPLALKYVLPCYRTTEVCAAAVHRDGLVLEHVPYGMQEAHPELCMIAVTTTGMAIQYVASHLQTLELCARALDTDPTAWVYINNATTLTTLLRTRSLQY
jgi:hypothetical protein